MASFSSLVLAHLLTLASPRNQYNLAFCGTVTSKRSLNLASNPLSHLSHHFPTTSSIYNNKTARRIPSSPSTFSAMKSTLDDSNVAVDSFSTYLTTLLPTTIQSLLKNRMQAENEVDTKTLNFIMGNQAGDADSIISSLALSYVKKLEKLNSHGTGGGKLTTSLSLPIVCIEKEDLALRRDVTLLLRLSGITNHDSLTYLNDDAFQSLLNDGGNGQYPYHKSFTLVDHNKIRSELWQFENAVIEIYDHHQDEGCHLESCTIREVAFENQKATVGSTCTIVTEKLSNLCCEDGNVKKIDGGLGLTLLGVILLDTMNMNPDAAKGTPRDENAIEFLLENSEWDNLDTENIMNVLVKDNNGQTKPDRVKLYEYLRDSKFDPSFWQEMSARDALRIDYKRFEPKSSSGFSFGLSSVLLNSNMILSKSDFYDSAIEYMKEVDIHMLGVLCMVIVDDTPQREMILIGKTDTMDSLTNYFQNDSSAMNLKVSLAKEYDSKESFVMRRFNQGNPKGSRKQIAPVLLSFFSRS